MTSRTPTAPSTSPSAAPAPGRSPRRPPSSAAPPGSRACPSRFARASTPAIPITPRPRRSPLNWGAPALPRDSTASASTPSSPRAGGPLPAPPDAQELRRTNLGSRLRRCHRRGIRLHRHRRPRPPPRFLHGPRPGKKPRHRRRPARPPPPRHRRHSRTPPGERVAREVHSGDVAQGHRDHRAAGAAPTFGIEPVFPQPNGRQNPARAVRPGCKRRRT